MVVKITERRVHEVRHALLADVRRRAERSQMRAHEPQEVQHDAEHCKPECRPAIHPDLRGLPPVGRHRDEVARHEPDAHVRHHVGHHGYCRQGTPDHGQPLVPARITHERADRAFFLFPRHKFLRSYC